MSNSARSAHDKRLNSLLDAMENAFGSYERQSGSNGDEYMFHCPLCVRERGDEGHRKHLRVSASSGERKYPYVGCRKHTEDWQEIRKELVKAGVPGKFLAPVETKKDAAQIRAPRASGPGLGERDPIDSGLVDDMCRALLRSPRAEKYREYLINERGLTREVIKKYRIGIKSNVYNSIRITIPVKNADGNYVNIRCYNPFPKSNKDVKMLPWQHPKEKKPGSDTPATYGSPARIYGLESIVEGEPIFFCAGEFDRLVLEANGIRAATGVSGESTIPRLEDCELLTVASEIVIVYDSDDAGRTGAKKLAQSLMKIGAEQIKIIDLQPDGDSGYDVTDFFVKDSRTKSEFMGIVDGTDYLDPPEPPIELNDRRMAEIVCEEYGDSIQYCVDEDVWMKWDGKRWCRSGKKDPYEPSNAVIKVARSIRDEKLADTPKQAKWYENIIRTSQVRAIVTQMCWLDDMRVFNHDLDTHRKYLNVQNGMINLETGMMQDPDPKLFLSKITKNAYVPGLKHQMWTDFLDRFVPGEEMQTYLQRLIGYCIEDGNPHRLFIALKGKTSTGKSAFAESVQRVLGEYAGAFNLSIFRDKQDESPRADIVKMLTQRAGFASETSNEWHLHADSIKRITGADTMTARLLHSNTYVERVPAFTPIICTNAAPTIQGADLAVFRRLRVVPFEEQITEDEEDPNFVSRMIEEAGDAILSWVIDGYMDYRINGFSTKPEACIAAELEFRDEVSSIMQFISDHCIEGGEHKIPVDDLYQAYTTWAFSSGFSGKDIMNKIAFGRRLSGLGYESKVFNGVRHRLGIAVRGAEKLIG